MGKYEFPFGRRSSEKVLLFSETYSDSSVRHGSPIRQTSQFCMAWCGLQTGDPDLETETELEQIEGQFNLANRFIAKMAYGLNE